MLQAEIREHFINELIPAFGPPKNGDGLALMLEKYVPGHATGDTLAAVAEQIIETRKARGFPAASELIAAVKMIRTPGAPRPQTQNDINREREEAERRAESLLRDTDIARRACDEAWGPALYWFVVERGMLPDAAEERRLIAQAQANNRNAPMAGFGLPKLREVMHNTARRKMLTGARLCPPQTGSTRRRQHDEREWMACVDSEIPRRQSEPLPHSGTAHCRDSGMRGQRLCFDAA